MKKFLKYFIASIVLYVCLAILSNHITDGRAWIVTLLLIGFIAINIYLDCTVQQRAEKNAKAETEAICLRFQNNPMVKELATIFYNNDATNCAKIYTDKIQINYKDYYYAAYGYDKLDLASTRQLAIYLGYNYPVSNSRYVVRKLTSGGGSGNYHYVETISGRLESVSDYWEVDVGYSVTIYNNDQVAPKPQKW